MNTLGQVEVELTDAELVKGAQGGSLNAFEALAARYERQVFGLALRMLRQEQDAEDVTQQTFLNALENLDGFRGESAFSTWLLRIATHAALNVLRKRRGLATVSLEEIALDLDNPRAVPHPEFIADWRQSPEQLAHQNDIHHLLEDALTGLNEKLRLVFLLRDVEELSVKETAAVLGLTEVSIKVRLLRARLQLRERLTRVLGDPTRRVAPPHHHEK